MGQPAVAMGASLMCTMGAAPATLTPIPMGQPVQIESQLAATIMDFQPMANIPTFGMCMSPANPQVAAATAAAMGVLTPMPCIPMTTAPWTPGDPTVMINGNPALTASSMCMCTWAGQITIAMPGPVKTQV